MICAALAIVAMGVTLYPLVSNLISETNRSIIETKYTKAVEKMDDTEKIRARTDAQNYNATLQAVTEKPYTKDALQKAAESYDHLLNIRGDGIMGYLEIPVLSLELPIYHGTEESTLDRGLGHLLGSSLPVGGQGTHTVITGHSGLAGKRMFSDLDQMIRPGSRLIPIGTAARLSPVRPMGSIPTDCWCAGSGSNTQSRLPLWKMQS